MRAIFRRELRAYFQSPLGYVFIGAMFFFAGYYFLTYNLYGSTTDMSTSFKLLFSVALILVPILTMRLLSEDKRYKTDQLLLTAPVTRTGIVLGKYFAALTVYLIAISSTLIEAVVMSFFAAPAWPVVIGNFLGLFLLGVTLIAVCLFLSGLTESQVIAAVAGFGVGLFLMMIDSLAVAVENGAIKAVLHGISFNSRYLPFTMGVLELQSVVFFVSIAAMFLCFAVAVLDRKRWS